MLPESCPECVRGIQLPRLYTSPADAGSSLQNHEPGAADAPDAQFLPWLGRGGSRQPCVCGLLPELAVKCRCLSESRRELHSLERFSLGSGFLKYHGAAEGGGRPNPPAAGRRGLGLGLGQRCGCCPRGCTSTDTRAGTAAQHGETCAPSEKDVAPQGPALDRGSASRPASRAAAYLHR